jgi:hypothetical protein
MSKSKWTEKDTSRETGDSIREVNRAWHEARNQAAKEGGWNVPENRHDRKEEKEEKKEEKK